MQANRMDRTCINNPTDPRFMRCLPNIITTDDISMQNVIKGLFIWVATKMHDHIRPLDYLGHFRIISEVSLNKTLPFNKWLC